MEVVRKGRLRVVGIRVEADWQGLWVSVPQAWGTFLRRVEEVSDRVGDGFLDVSLGRSDGIYAQVVGAEVGTAAAVPAGMESIEIPAGEYVNHLHRGPVTEIAESFGAMYAWAEEQGIAVDELKLDVGYTLSGTETEHDLYVRIVRRSSP